MNNQKIHHLPNIRFPFHFFVTILLGLVSVSPLFSQSVNLDVGEVEMPTPNVAAFLKYSETPVSTFTGVPSIQIPMFAIGSGYVKDDIALSYHAAGFKPSAVASWVGLDWSLSAGGSISRQVVGRADDHMQGYINGAFLTEPDTAIQHDVLDTEPDVFHYRVDGYSGTMLYSHEKNNGTGGWHVYPKNDVLITSIHNGDAISGFTLVTPEGTKYLFGMGAVDVIKSNDQNHHALGVPNTSTWHLIQVTSKVQGDTLTYSYDDVNYKYEFNSSTTYSNLTYSTTYCGCVSSNDNNQYIKTIHSFVQGKRLAKITSSRDQSEVVFSAVDIRDDLEPHSDPSINVNTRARALNSVTLKSNGSTASDDYCRSFQLTHDYSNPNSVLPRDKRLFLKEIKEISCNSNTPTTPTKPYVFTYHGETVDSLPNLPSRLSRQIDHWGYFNGVEANENKSTSIPYDAHFHFQDTVYYHLNGNMSILADRTTGPDFMKLGVLKEIKHPTDGVEKFYLSTNTEYKFLSGPSGNIVDNQYSNCNANPNFNFTSPAYYFSQYELDSTMYELVLDLTDKPDCACATVNRFDYTIHAKDSTGTSVSTISGGIGSPGCHEYGYFDLPLSNFRPALYPNTAYTFEATIEIGRGDVHFTIKDVNDIYGNEPVGGLRVDSILSLSELGDSIMTSYNYNDGNGRSTGKVLIEPSYGYRIDESTSDYFVIGIYFASYSFNATSDISGQAFGYKQVIKNKGPQRSIYHHKIEKHALKVFPFSPAQPIYENGLLDSVLQKKANNSAFNYQKRLDSFYIPSFNALGQNDHGRKWFKFPPPEPTGTQTYFPIYVKRTYPIWRPSYLKTIREEIITDGLKQNLLYEYNTNGHHVKPTKVTTTDSSGLSISIETNYAHDVYPGNLSHFLIANNIVGIPLETTKDGGLGGGAKRDFSDTHVTGLILPVKSYFLDQNQNWILDREVIQSNAIGQPLETWSRQSSLNKHYVYGSSVQNKSKLISSTTGSFTTHINYKNPLTVSFITGIDGREKIVQFDGLGRLVSSSEHQGNAQTFHKYYQGHKIGLNLRVDSIVYANSVGSDLDFLSTHTLIDGLGRTVQTTSKEYSPDQKDIINRVLYNDLGQMTHSYEPYEYSGSPTDSLIAIPSSQPFTFNRYESSPSARLIGSTPPEWHESTTTYGTNTTNEVYDYKNSTYFLPTTLSKSTVTDPNGHAVQTFNDINGNLIASYRLDSLGTVLSKTHYLYDDRYRQTHILPPETNLSSPNIYRFSYDSRDNLIWKKIPGKDTIRYQYDVQDRMTYMKDGIQPWIHYEYDTLDREIATYQQDPGSSNGILLSTKVYDGTIPIQKGKLVYSTVYLADTPRRFIHRTYQYDIYGRVEHIYGNHELNLTSEAPWHEYFDYDFADNVLRHERILYRTDGSSISICDSMTYDHSGRMKAHFFRINNQTEQISELSYTIKDELSKRALGGTTTGFLQELDYTYLSNGFLKSINQSQLASATITNPSSCPISVDPCMVDPSGFAAANDDLFYLELSYDQLLHADLTSTAQKNGNISQMTWRTVGSPTTAYGYQYDGLDRLKQARYAQVCTDLSTATTNKGLYDVDITYADARGNISSLKRNGWPEDKICPQKNVIDDLVYTYQSNSDLLINVTDNGDASARQYGYKAQTGSIENYAYDDNGNMTYDPSQKVTIVYNRFNLPDSVLFDDGKILVNKYNEAGLKYRQLEFSKNQELVNDRYYIEKIQIVNGEIESIHHDEGRVVNQQHAAVYYITDTIRGKTLHVIARAIVSDAVIDSLAQVTFEACDSILHLRGFTVRKTGDNMYDGIIGGCDTVPQWQHEYNITDHLGNIRVIFADRDDNGQLTASDDPATNEVLETRGYYPYGMQTYNGFNYFKRPDQALKSKYNYNGKEEIAGTGYLFFDTRTYDLALGRFLQTDMISDQFPHVSTRNYAENEPVANIDLHGLQSYSSITSQAMHRDNPTLAKDPEFRKGMQTAEGIGLALAGAALTAAAALEAGTAATISYVGTEIFETAVEETTGIPFINDFGDAAQQGVKKIFKEGSEKVGKAKNKLAPNPDAKGDHTSFDRDNDGNIFKYEEYKSNPQNPTGFDSKKRFDGGKRDGSRGDDHFNKKTKENVPTPHVQGKDIPGGVRPATTEEIPGNLRFN